MVIRSFLFTVIVMAFTHANAQVVYYPSGASQLLQSTAIDVAMLLQKAIPGSNIQAVPYTSIPVTGLVLVYDGSITDNQNCKVKSVGNSSIQFRAAEDNGLHFGIYQYLQQLGFRFYQPGSIWEITPTLASVYRTLDTVYSCAFRYKNWFVSGGCNAWVMDNNNSYYWDTYNGENGHQLSLYMRRNCMLGSSRFAGHRDDILTESYLTTLRNNPCYVAPYNGSRIATGRSVPDVHNQAAMDLWSSSIEQQYTRLSNTIRSNPALYANLYRNFSYAYKYIGIEVPDGANWANSVDQLCNIKDFASESDQHFTLANYTASKIGLRYPAHRFQLYAYDGHADVPSAGISIHPSLDVQVVSTAFQNETSSKGLLARWYKRCRNISEYQYLNLPQWSGETPSFFLDELKEMVARAKEQHAAGIVWEASPAKFASLPYLWAANMALKDNVSIDSCIANFCNQLFGPAAGTIAQLMKYWTSNECLTISNGIQDNKYKLPLYLSLVQQAHLETLQAAPLVRERIRELKAYLHYMVLYFDWLGDQRLVEKKAEKAAKLCLYLAKIHHLQLVNSYFLINDIVYKFPASHPFVASFNTANGTAYANGQLPLITSTEIDAAFDADVVALSPAINNYTFASPAQIINAFAENGLEPLEKIQVKVNYTFGKDYSTRTAFSIVAHNAGSFTIRYTPKFEMAGKGYLNFTVESADDNLNILKDVSFNQSSGAGILYVSIPAAGNYVLNLVTKYKTSVELMITTNGNFFYKNGPFLGNTIENYRADLLSLPGYFYVPAGLNKIYFSLNNSNPAGAGFASEAEIAKAFAFLNHLNQPVVPKLVTSGDSALFYLEVPSAAQGKFWKAFKMEQYRLCFANISNYQWYLRKKTCAGADFKTTILPGCITALEATVSAQSNEWKIYDQHRWWMFSNSTTVTLPENTSGAAIVYFSSNGCSIARRLSSDASYMRQKAACATGGALAPEPNEKPVLYPNPSQGLVKIVKDGEPVLATDIQIYSVGGEQVARFANTQQFSIGRLPAGNYLYQIVVNQSIFKGQLIKM